jgi:hypothetical protein
VLEKNNNADIKRRILLACVYQAFNLLTNHHHTVLMHNHSYRFGCSVIYVILWYVLNDFNLSWQSILRIQRIVLVINFLDNLSICLGYDTSIFLSFWGFFFRYLTKVSVIIIFLFFHILCWMQRMCYWFWKICWTINCCFWSSKSVHSLVQLKKIKNNLFGVLVPKMSNIILVSFHHNHVVYSIHFSFHNIISV